MLTIILTPLLGISLQILFNEWLYSSYYIKEWLGISHYKAIKPIDCPKCLSFWFSVIVLILIYYGLDICFLAPFLVPLTYKIVLKYIDQVEL